MFGRKKDEDDDAKPEIETADEAAAPMPLRSRTPQMNEDPTPPTRAPVSRPEAPRRMPEMPGARPIGRAGQSSRDDGKKLIVGREIVLNGEITSCDRLVVEGRVEANMNDCHEIEIAETGTFKGQAEIDRADISGVFEGDLTVREHLVVRASGRITGKVRFGELEIERGGQIVGDVQVYDESSSRRHEEDRIAVESPAQ